MGVVTTTPLTLAAAPDTENGIVKTQEPLKMDNPLVPDNPTSFDGSVSITVVYDNISYDPALQTDWGFAAWIEVDDVTILFDTGANSRILMANLDVLGLDPAQIDYLVFSHTHQDHIGGAIGLVDTGIKPQAYLLPQFNADFRRELAERIPVELVSGWQQISPGIFITGPIEGSVVEQALVIETSQGLVVITGCAHPGITNMVEYVSTEFEQQVYLVMGGFHLRNQPAEAVDLIVETLNAMGVKFVAPSHCSGDAAIARFKAGFGERFLASGAGAHFLLDSPHP